MSINFSDFKEYLAQDSLRNLIIAHGEAVYGTTDSHHRKYNVIIEKLERGPISQVQKGEEHSYQAMLVVYRCTKSFYDYKVIASDFSMRTASQAMARLLGKLQSVPKLRVHVPEQAMRGRSQSQHSR